MSLDATSALIDRLNQLAREEPELAGPARLYAAILPLLHRAGPLLSITPPLPFEARACLAQGLSLLSQVELEVDENAAAVLVEEVLRQMEQLDLPGSSAIRSAIARGFLPMSRLLASVVAGDASSVTAHAGSLGLDGNLLWAVMQNVIRPSLRECRAQLGRIVEGVPWSRNYCPVCGALATIAELQGSEHQRHLRCGLCGADWPLRRDGCVYCGNEDAITLGSLRADQAADGPYAALCDGCGGYLKVITVSVPTRPEFLLAEDLATLYLDNMARERGYHRDG